MGQANNQFQKLYETLHDKMLRVAYRMVGNVDTAEDLVQNAFLLALFREDEVMRHPLPEGWLMRVLQNLARNEQKRAKQHPETSLDSLFYVAGETPSSSLDEVLPTQLSTQERDMDYSEIANRLGISEPGCRSRVSRAIKRCRELLQQP